MGFQVDLAGVDRGCVEVYSMKHLEIEKRLNLNIERRGQRQGICFFPRPFKMTYGKFKTYINKAPNACPYTVIW